MNDKNQGKSAIHGQYEQIVAETTVLGVNKTFGRNDKGRGNTEEYKEKDFTISYDKVFTENIFD
ncbi:MAG: hypothetical protein II900_01495 [Prevotella sp.]|nr:hypothetical protein [Prevotella sp.]